MVEWVDVFTRKDYVHLVVESLQYCQKEKGLIIYGWCIMSNHVHLIVSAAEGFTLSAILRDFKKFTAYSILKAMEQNPQESRRNWMLWLFRAAGEKNSKNTKYQFWQQDNHPIALESNRFKEEKLYYLHQNPVAAGLVAEAHHYIYSSALDYAGGKGLISVTFL